MTKRPIYPSCNIAEVNEFDLYVANPISHLNRLFISELFGFCLVLALVRVPCRMRPIRYSLVTFTHETQSVFSKYITPTHVKEMPMCTCTVHIISDH